MRYGKYEFVCRFEDEAHLPPFKGSTVRGLLGHALKRTVCVLKRQECADCLLRHDCLYARMFGLPPPTEKAAVNSSAEPHPFVLEPPLEEKTVYQPGETITIGLILFGEINRKLPYFIYAFDEMGRIGMGKRVTERRARFILEEVRWNKTAIYTSQTGTVLMPEVLPLLWPENEMVENTPPLKEIHVDLLTSLRFKSNGHLNDSLSFDQLIRLALRRCASLNLAFGSGEPNLDYPGMIEGARAVQTNESRLRWQDGERYSSRQKQRVPLGGLVGKIIYSGNLQPFLQLLNFCEAVHIGKNTSFGLGQIRCA